MIMDKKLKERLEQHSNVLPLVADYCELLSMAVQKFGITTDDARDKFGLYSYGDWAKLLG